MNFFDYIKNDAFFKPLTLKYRRVYYDCIQILIDKTKELPVLYESVLRWAMRERKSRNGRTWLHRPSTTMEFIGHLKHWDCWHRG